MATFSLPINNRHILESAGPALNIRISAPSALSAFQAGASRSSVVGRGIIDTGAHATVIRSGIAHDLGVWAFDQVSLVTASGPVLMDRFVLRLEFLQLQMPARDVLVAEANLPSSVAMLIGRDILSDWKIEYDGPAGS